ncbi:peptidoglycan D,D-transpeptidase FtsI family protein [Auraticoccus monumenti]|uniref:Cell elongation-specific peptidoglycan D,D-transpeptidase n=1 Tax=Auraticoccus monumenti TaxID=675864 RepID=A0A1G6SNN6_9ACTN|nr:penicillin-binding protein 2 [Auraticoccus monumenti]SDD18428.1 cell elongation-specific peptidoglycan D,D-transpeptidase [Auraticoccus monumenti]
MNRPIRRVALVCMVLFGLLLGNGTFLIVVQQNSLNANPLNRRVRDAEFSQDRGAILVGTTPIAETRASDGDFRYQRVYPDPELYAHVTGWYSYDRARSGLEESYNTELAGTDDSLFVRRLVDLVTGRTPEGASITTTIDPDAQRAAAEALGDTKGAVVALDPQTGAVLAMVSHPSYDPNRIADAEDVQAANEAYTELAEDEDNPLANRAAREVYPPGSTFKLVTAAAALESGMAPDAELDSPELLRLPGTTTDLGNDTDCGGETTTLDRALQVSCNTAFANLGVDLGADALRQQAEAFGFGTRHLADLNGVASRFPEAPDDAQTALSAIGQFDVAASPLQMAMVAAAVANDGVVMEPYLVDQVRAPNLSVLRQTRPQELGRAMSAENAAELQQMMVNVVQDGTGTNARLDGIEVGGKTGTAQSDLSRNPFAWFVSAAPMDDPQVAVAVFVEDADIARNDIAGGRLAAPIARAVTEAVVR